MKTHTLPLTLGLWAATVAGAYFIGMQNRNDSLDVAEAGTAAVGRVSTSTSGGAHVPVTVDGTAGAPWRADKDSPSMPSAQAIANVRAAIDNPNMIERTRAILGALEGLDNDGMKQAYELIRTQEDGMAARAQGMLLMYAWGRKDPEAALAFNKENGSERGSFSVLSSWAQVSPDKAIAWALADAQKDEQGNLAGDNWSMVGVVHGLTKSDLGKAAEALQTMNRSNARGEALDMVVEKFARTDPDGMRGWVATISDPVLRAGAAERVGRRLAESDPAQAATWAATLPDAQSKSRAAESVIQRWAQTDPNAAGEWIKATFPVGSESDVPRESFAKMIDGVDPQSALAWAGTISNQERRDAVISSIARDWLRREGDAARAVLQNTPNLPEGVRSRLERR